MKHAHLNRAAYCLSRSFLKRMKHSYKWKQNQDSKMRMVHTLKREETIKALKCNTSEMRTSLEKKNKDYCSFKTTCSHLFLAKTLKHITFWKTTLLNGGSSSCQNIYRSFWHHGWKLGKVDYSWAYTSNIAVVLAVYLLGVLGCVWVYLSAFE